MCESFNAVIINARRKPLITMLEEIRLFVMERSYRLRTKAETWKGGICPAIIKKVTNRTKHTRDWFVVPSGGNVFEVRNMYGQSFSVDVDRGQCSCRLWQLSGIPCLHSICALNFMNTDPLNYVSKWFDVQMYKDAYKPYILPLSGSNMWQTTSHLKPLPPKERRMPGRPSINRKRHESETQGSYKRVSTAGRVMTCSNCHETGHTTRYCKNESRATPQKPPAKRGRPKLKTPTINRTAATSMNQGHHHMATSGLHDVAVDGPDLVDVHLQESQGLNTFVDAPIQESQTFEDMDVQEAAAEVLEAAEEVLAATQKDDHPLEVVNAAAEVLEAAKGVQEQARKRIVKPFIKPRHKSERILKNKLKNFNFDKDGEGSTKDKSLKID